MRKLRCHQKIEMRRAECHRKIGGMKKLTWHQKFRLRRRFKASREPSERDRIRVVLGFDRGTTIEDLAKILMLSEGTVRKYVADYREKKKTLNAPRGGSDGKLTIEEAEILDKYLSENTYCKVKDICSYVEKVFHKKFSRSGMTAWLKQHNFVFKRPKPIPGKLNIEQQEQFIKEYEDLKKNLKPDEVILFGDAMHPQYQSKPVCGWMKKGEEKTLQTTGKQVRMHVAGALSLDPLEVIIEEYKSVDGDAMIDLCKKIEECVQAPTIYLILDNARAGKNKKLDEYLKSSRIKIKYLPPYSPNLNSIERVWKIVKEETMDNRYYESAALFFKTVRGFFADLPDNIAKWSARINDNFQRIELNPINIAAG